MNASDLDFAGLGAALLDFRTMSDFARRGTALAPFRVEIALIMIGLRKAEITGSNDRPADPAQQCDGCNAALLDGGLYVDGALNCAAGWANLCMDCFATDGRGLGWGVGQLYAHDGIGWQCIAGGDPSPKEDREE